MGYKLKFKIHLETKSNVRKESNTLEEVKGNEKVLQRNKEGKRY